MKTALKLIRRMLIWVVIAISVIAVATILFLRQPQLGKAPSGSRLERMKQSPHFRDGIFHNISYTPSLTEGYSFSKIFFDFLFKKVPDSEPQDDIPSVRTDLKQLPDDVLVWFGHSSYLLRTNGLTFLVDPVFSGGASPIAGFTKAFRGSDLYNVEDLPKVDYLIITHDHYDHLDYRTVKQLKDKVATVICGLGVGAHFEHWGYPSGRIIEKDWNETEHLSNGALLRIFTARHFSGRGLKRNNTLWISLLLETPDLKIFLGGDGGYDTHFKEIGRQYGPIDFAILENGQYNVAWHAIHCLPEETLQAAQDLAAKRIFPVHSSKFALGMHAWYAPLDEITRCNQSIQIPMVTPKIGEVVYLRDSSQQFSRWWEELKVSNK